MTPDVLPPAGAASSGPPWLRQALTDRAAAADLVTAVLEEAGRHGVALDFPPPPEPTTCCGRGCNGCVWEGYFAALAYWRARAAFTLYGVTAD